ncbi:hypothetical protein OC845_004309 [Tilletia horrida]|nr:hypothetical protein OC845_004309 [Tilletia horrida]
MASTKRSLTVRLAETAAQYWHLGMTSFGGPGVHVVILRRKFVDRLKWVDSSVFIDLFTLGNALPGPGSTQLAFSIAIVRNGSLAGLLAFLLWSLPGAFGMSALGVGVRKLPDQLPPIVLALLTGLNAAAVGLIALAAYQLALNCITDHFTRLILLTSASFGICYHAPWMYPVLIFSGGIITLLWDSRQVMLKPVKAALDKKQTRNNDADREQPQSEAGTLPVEDIELSALPASSNPINDTSVLPGNASTKSGVSTRQRHVGTSDSGGYTQPLSPPGSPARALGAVNQSEIEAPVEDEEDVKLMLLPQKYAVSILIFFLTFVVTVIVVRAKLNVVPRAFDFFTNMVIAGLIIFGGGPVVVPLLRSYVVQTGWVSDRDFLLGFAILQAAPGILAVNQNPALGAFLGWLGIFSPGLILKFAVLPYYSRWRKHQAVRSVLRGLNAAASGLVFSATYQLYIVGYIYQSAAGERDQKTQSGSLTADPFWTVVVAGSFVATQYFSSPPWLSIGAGAVAGLAWYGVQMS